jgi:hypothetical protein
MVGCRVTYYDSITLFEVKKEVMKIYLLSHFCIYLTTALLSINDVWYLSANFQEKQ